MSEWKVTPKKPNANHQIWAGPERMSGTLPAKETEKHRTRREALGNKLEHLVGKDNVTWNKPGRMYLPRPLY